jgi:hypothetical protein
MEAAGTAPRGAKAKPVRKALEELPSHFEEYVQERLRPEVREVAGEGVKIQFGYAGLRNRSHWAFDEATRKFTFDLPFTLVVSGVPKEHVEAVEDLIKDEVSDIGDTINDTFLPENFEKKGPFWGLVMKISSVEKNASPSPAKAATTNTRKKTGFFSRLFSRSKGGGTRRRRAGAA